MAGDQGKIGSLYVELEVQGEQKLLSALKNAGTELAALHDRAQAAWSATHSPFRGVGQVFAGLHTALQGAAGAVGGLVAPLQGMVMQGIAASGAGQVLALQWQEVNRQMASVFVPTIQTVMQKLSQLIGWFRGLTGEQQANLRQLGLFAAGLTLSAAVVPRVVAGVQALTTVIRGLALAQAGLALTNPFTLVAAGVGAAVLNTMSLGDAMKGVAETMKGVGQALKGAGAALKEISTTARGLRENVKGGIQGATGGIAARLADLIGAPTELHGKKLDPQQRWAAGWMQLLETSLVGTGINRTIGAAVRNAMGFPEAPGKRTELPPALGGFEDVTESWRRVALTSRHVGGPGGDKRPEEATAENTSRMKDLMEAAVGWFQGGLSPLVATVKGVPVR